MTSRQPPSSRTIEASDFKARCAQVLDDVRATGTEIVITDRGKPVARLGPIVPVWRSLRGIWKGMARIRGDIVHVDWSSYFDAMR